MGYEHRIYIVDKTNVKDPFEDKYYGNTLAIFNLGKFHEFKIFTEPTDCYVYADDNNTKILKDEYNKPLLELSLAETSTLTKEFIKTFDFDLTSSRFIPFIPFIAALDSFIEQQRAGKYHNLVCLHYGY